MSQKGDDNHWHPVAFGSRTLNDAERRYHSSKLEFLALKWAVCDHFREYLEFCPSFEVRTDNNPLTYVMSTPNLDACGQRWVEKLSKFKFSLTYLKGVNNGAADAMSRLPRRAPRERLDPEEAAELPPESCRCCVARRVGRKEPERQSWSQEMVSKFLDAAVEMELDPSIRAECELPCMLEAEERITEAGISTAARRSKLVDYHTLDWVQLQREDPLIARTMDYCNALYEHRNIQQPSTRKQSRKLDDRKPDEPDRDPESEPSLKDYLGELARSRAGREFLNREFQFCLIGGKLYLTLPDTNRNDPVKVFVVPPKKRVTAMNGCHRDAGHQGRDRTLSLLTERFWWPFMQQQVKNHVAACDRCQRFEGKNKVAPLVPIHATAPLDLVHLDYTTCETSGGTQPTSKPGNILCIVDHFTRFVVAVNTPSQTAAVTAKAFYDHFIAVFGAPRRIVSDQGGSFTGDVIASLCDTFGISRTTTSAYHPQTNGQVERWNQTLLRMVGKLAADEKYNWKNHLSELAQAYNSTRCSVTGYSPHFLMFGRRPRLPVDVQFPTIRNSDITIRLPEYIASLREHFRLAYDEARLHSNQEAARHKRRYDSRATATRLEPGDRVLKKVDKIIGRRKIQDRWSDEGYTVVEALGPDCPLYRIVDDAGRVQIAHRNKLFCVATSQDGLALDPSWNQTEGLASLPLDDTLRPSDRASGPEPPDESEGTPKVPPARKSIVQRLSDSVQSLTQKVGLQFGMSAEGIT